MARIYMLNPVQALYSTAERDKLYDVTCRLLRSIPYGSYVKIYVLREPTIINIAETEHIRVNIYHTYIVAEDVSIEPPNSVIIDKLPIPEIVETYGRYVRLSDGRYATTLVICDMRYDLLEYAILTEVIARIGSLESFSHIAILAKNIGRRVFKYLESARERFSYRRSQESKLYVERESQLIEEAFIALAQGDTILMTVPVIVLADYDIDSLENDVKIVISELESRGLDVWRPDYLHHIFYSLDLSEIRRGLYLTATSFSTIYTPYVSHRVIEEDGILIGTVIPTGEPVIFNPFIHTNPHILIAGRTGSGKSFFTKCFIRRLVEWKRSNVEIYIIDPEGEYARLAKYGGLLRDFSVISLDFAEGCGLDPIKTYLKHATEEEEHDRALTLIVHLLRELYNIPGIYENELFEATEKSETIFEVPEKVSSQELKISLERMYKPPDCRIFQGEPIDITSRLTIIDLSSIRACVDERTLSTVCILLAAYLRTRLVRPSSDTRREKYLVIDEGWLLFRHRATADFIEEASRTFRKRNTSLIFITQSLDDVARFGNAEIILQNVATLILFHHDEIRHVRNLDEEELDILRQLSRGTYLLKTDSYRLVIHNTPTETELKKIK